MKRLFCLIMCFFCFSNSPLKANEDLINLYNLAVENGDIKIINEVLEEILKEEYNNENLLDSIIKYSDKGSVRFSLNNAIKDKNLLASVILIQYTKDMQYTNNYNTRKGQDVCCYGAIYKRDAKTPIELALEADLIGLIPYLLMKKADPYLMRQINFFFEGEENLDYLTELGHPQRRYICELTGKVFFEFYDFHRNLIGDAIANNRLDVIEILHRSKIDWDKPCCKIHGWGVFTPLRFALVTKNYEIAQFLLNHGAKIDF